ncbi:hypothetical protein D3C76_969890 [compost metagenome]
MVSRKRLDHRRNSLHRFQLSFVNPFRYGVARFILIQNTVDHEILVMNTDPF